MDQRRFNSGNKAAEEAQEIRACVVNYYKILIPRINEATDTDLKVIYPVRKFFSSVVERLTQHLGWKRGDTLLYQQAYVLIAEQQKIFEGQENEKIRGVK